MITGLDDYYYILLIQIPRYGVGGGAGARVLSKLFVGSGPKSGMGRRGPVGRASGLDLVYTYRTVLTVERMMNTIRKGQSIL